MRSVALLSLFASMALAQSNGTATPTTTSNPLIPSDVSATCQAFLSTLNQDTSLATCTSALIKSTSAFAPSSNSSATTAQITTALGSMCDDSLTGCSETDIRSQLAKFVSACTAELTGSSPNTVVHQTFDVLYTLMPFKNAICAKDESTGKYCIFQIATPPEVIPVVESSTTAPSSKSATAHSGSGTASAASASSTASANDDDNNNGDAAPPKNLAAEDSDPLADAIALAGTYLSVPLEDPAPALRVRDNSGSIAAQSPIGLAPNATTFSATSLLYLFTLPSFSQTQLCTNCTAAVMEAYASWEGSTPYAGGLLTSPMLAGQMSLWQNVQSKCGDAFYDGVLAGAGASAYGNGTSTTSSAPRTSFDHNVAALLGAVMLGIVAGF